MAYVKKCTKFVKDLDLSRWDYAISKEHYDKVLANDAKNKEDLVELDNWFLHELPKTVKDRDEPHLLKSELSKLVKWKITKGTWRPKLEKYIEELTSHDVIEKTKEGYKIAASGEVKAAYKVLCKLRGVGAATASAILSVYDPHIPFMGDEALDVLVKSRNYRVPEALLLMEKCTEIANKLNKKRHFVKKEEKKEEGDTAEEQTGKSVNWTPTLVQLALWAVAHSEDFDEKESKAKRPLSGKKSEEESEEEEEGGKKRRGRASTPAKRRRKN